MELLGREIFAVGKWNGMEFTEADLDDIVANFEALSDIHKVPLKFGHNDEQPITDGQPALGWVSRVFRQGNKLFADLTDLPKTVFEAVKKKLYRTVSIELLFDVDHKGQRYGHVFDAVALLGADHPAVNTLEDLDALLASRSEFTGGRRLMFETIAGKREKDPPPHQEENSMDDKAMKDFVAEAIDKAVTPLKDELAVVTKDRDDFKARAEKAEKEQADFKAEQRKQKIVAARKTVTDLLDAAVREKTMTPAMREVYEAQIGVADDDRVLEIDVDKVKLMCNIEHPKDELAEARRKKAEQQESGDPAQDLTTKTYAFMAEHSEKSFTRALEAVARANPDLHRAYLDQNQGD